MFSDATISRAATVLKRARQAGLVLTTAESCTGGLVSACLTAVPGSSSVFDRGFVTYTNKAKAELLGVPADLIETHGAVSEEVARAMAEGALERSGADVSVSITGIAGPDGGSPTKPVGLVWFGGARKGRLAIAEKKLFGDIGRDAVRAQSVDTALEILGRLLD